MFLLFSHPLYQLVSQSCFISLFVRNLFMMCLYVQVYVQEASNPTRVKVYGPALERPVKTNQPTYLIVDCSQAGPGAATNVVVFSVCCVRELLVLVA